VIKPSSTRSFEGEITTSALPNSSSSWSAVTETKFGATTTVASMAGEVEVTSTAWADAILEMTLKRRLVAKIEMDVSEVMAFRFQDMWRLSSRFVISHHSFYNGAMPTYQYLCTECGHEFEVVQSFSDDAISACEKCQGVVRKVYNSVGIVFKGSGFYKTDSRGSTSAKSETATSTGTSTSPAPATTTTSSTSTAGSSSD